MRAGGCAVLRSELVQMIKERHADFTTREAELIVTAFFDAIVRQLQADGRVELRGFGMFTTRAREARQARNPRTGEGVKVPAKRVTYFRPGKELRERLNADAPADVEYDDVLAA
nr:MULTISPECIES: HU family DNA-binding protein [Sphingomonas]